MMISHYKVLNKKAKIQKIRYKYNNFMKIRKILIYNKKEIYI